MVDITKQLGIKVISLLATCATCEAYRCNYYFILWWVIVLFL